MLRALYNSIRRLLRLQRQEPSVRLRQILGFEPIRLDYYLLALTHSSYGQMGPNNIREDNERLEFLGDAILSAAISHHLYTQHPTWQEGKLTKQRSALVNRTVANAVSKRMELYKLLRYRHSSKQKMSEDVHGNTLEALVGAIFLDRGYQMAEAFVMERILPLFYELEESLVEVTTNYKSRLLEWAQARHLSVDYRMLQEPKRAGGIFICAIYLQDERISTGQGYSKKEAHQAASHIALEVLGVLEPRPKDQ